MKSLIKCSLLVIASIAAFFSARSQGTIYPRIGSECPNFVSDKVVLSEEHVSLDQYRGKYVILDFWTIGCVPCVGSFPKMNEFNAKFRDKLKIILIGREEKNRDVKAFYNRFRNRFELSMTSIIDSTIFERYVPGTVPYLIWIDRKGMIKAITSTEDVNEENISKFLSDESFAFSDVSQPVMKTPRLTENTKEISQKKNDKGLIYESSIREWHPGLGARKTKYINEIRNDDGTYSVVKVDLTTLYNLAYFGSEDYIQGKYYPIPILSVRDSALFKYEYSGESSQRYIYQMRLPKREIFATEVMSIMQKDLCNGFGYSVQIIKAFMPCLSLIVTDNTRLRTAIRGSWKPIGRFKWDIESKDNRIVGYRVKDLPKLLSMYLGNPLKNFAFDETGINDRINLNFHGDIDDLKNIRRQLASIGLDLVPTSRLFPVLYIKD